jgi:Fe-S-cluster containining protein
MEHSRGAYCLNLHSDYLCHHRGACCTAGWNIPIEPEALAKVAVHFRSETLFRQPVGAVAAHPPPTFVNLRADGACVFFEEERGRLCAVHRELGADALPSACRHFPRVVLHDARGMMISLSHFCPTAADLLRAPAAPAVVAAPPNLSLDGTAEGLDARETLPPLLHPGMLTDHDGYAAWERRSIDILARADVSPGEALATIAAVTRTLQAWRPGTVSFRDAVEAAFDRSQEISKEEDDDPSGDERRAALAVASIPAGLSRPAALAGARDLLPDALQTMRQFDPSVSAYLAARLFGNWIAYHGTGLLAIVEYLRICLSVLKIEAARHSDCSSVSTPWQTVIEPAIRNADLLLVHLSDTRSLALRLSSGLPP